MDLGVPLVGSRPAGVEKRHAVVLQDKGDVVDLVSDDEFRRVAPRAPVLFTGSARSLDAEALPLGTSG
jgi:hypothetical protein